MSKVTSKDCVELWEPRWRAVTPTFASRDPHTCNSLHLNAGNASGAGLPQVSYLLHNQLSPPFFDPQHKKMTTLHQTLHNTLTIHSKHAKYHKSLKTCSLTPSLLLSFFCCHPSHNFPCSSATKSRVLPYNFVIGLSGAFFHQ